MRSGRAWILPGGGPRVLADLAVTVALFLLALVAGLVAPDAHGWSVGSLILAIAAFALVPLARRQPVPVMTALAVIFLTSQLWYDMPREFSLPLLYTAYAVTSSGSGSRRGRLVGVVMVAVVTDLSAALTPRDSWSDSRYLMIASWVLLTAAVGEAVRNRRAYVQEVEGRALHAEQTRESEATRRVSEERLRIARDVHDLVGHHIAVINVQAGVAGHLFDRDADAAKLALGQVRRAASAALQELGSVVGLLRQADDCPAAATDPSPTTADVPRLIASFAAAGLRVSLAQTGAADGVPASIELTAFRLIQESLTNAQKHGDGEANVLVAFDRRVLTIEVENSATVRRQPIDQTGHGLTGMRERVTAVGGTVHAGRTGGGRFQVRATLPLDRADIGQA